MIKSCSNCYYFNRTKGKDFICQCLYDGDQLSSFDYCFNWIWRKSKEKRTVAKLKKGEKA